MSAVIAAAPEEALKLILLVIVGGGLFALGRWSSRLAVTPGRGSPENAPTPDPQDLITDRESQSRGWPPSAEEVAASLPYDPALGKIQIKKFFFDKTDVTPGPDVPEIFAEELYVELYNPESGHSWWQSYFVATPQGLERILREKHWRYLHAPDVLIFPRYNLEEIRRAVVSRIVADHELFAGKGSQDEESL